MNIEYKEDDDNWIEKKLSESPFSKYIVSEIDLTKYFSERPPTKKQCKAIHCVVTNLCRAMDKFYQINPDLKQYLQYGCNLNVNGHQKAYTGERLGYRVVNTAINILQAEGWLVKT